MYNFPQYSANFLGSTISNAISGSIISFDIIFQNKLNDLVENVFIWRC